MANIKISNLPTASAITSDDYMPIVENTATQTQRADFSKVLNYITSSTFNTLEVTSLTASNLTVQGVLTAREFHTELVSASIIYQSGSTKFGNSIDDTHQLTGSLQQSGSVDNYFLGKVGIGTPTPQGLLSVTASTSDPAVRITQDGSGLALLVEDSTNPDSTPFVIDNVGNVGIGTTSPGTYKLNVNGTARAQQFYGTSDSNYYVEPDGTSYLKTTFFSTSPTGDYVEVSDTYIYGQGTVDSFNISSTGNSWLRSNVGIGTVSPSAYSVGARNLVITDASSDAGLTIHSSPTSQGRIYFSEAVSTGVASRRGQIVYDQNTDDMFFATTQTERMRIDSAGNVGIGTTNPSGKLDIVQSSTTPGLLLRNGDTSTGFTRPQIALSFNAGDQYRHFIHTRHDGGGPANNAIDFYVCNGTAVNSLTVGSTHNLTLEAGKVGIGTTSPSEKLEVVGNSIFSGSVEVSGTLRADVEVSGNITAASYTLSAADYGKTLLFSSSATQNITCSSGLDVGYNVTVIQAGTGQLNFSGSGVTLVNRFAHTSSAGQYSAVSVIVLNGTQYLVVGDTA